VQPFFESKPFSKAFVLEIYVNIARLSQRNIVRV
jgi:hypothetical protein